RLGTGRRRGGGGGVEGAVQSFPVRREGAASHVLDGVERSVGGGAKRERKIVGALLPHYSQRGRIVKREPRHEPRAIGRHRKNGRLAGDRAAAQDRGRRRFIDEQHRGRIIVDSAEAYDEGPVRRAGQLAAKRGGRPRQCNAGKSGRSGRRRGELHRRQLLRLLRVHVEDIQRLNTGRA